MMTNLEATKDRWDRAREDLERCRAGEWLPSQLKAFEDVCISAYEEYQVEQEREHQLQEAAGERIKLGSELEILRYSLAKVEQLTREVYDGPDTLKGRITLNNMMEAHRHAKKTLDMFGRNDDTATQRVRRMWADEQNRSTKHDISRNSGDTHYYGY